MMSSSQWFYGTIKQQQKFDAPKTAEKLAKAMKGIGCDKSKVLHELIRINCAQRQIVAGEYDKRYRANLVNDLKSELHGDFEDVIIALMLPPAISDARQLRKAISGLGTDEDSLIEIICSRSSDELVAIKRAYESEFARLLESDIKGDTSGDFKRLLVALIETKRDPSNQVDYQKADEAAQTLYAAGEKKWGTDEAAFNAILASQSLAQLRAVFDQYSVIAGHGIEKAIQSEFSGHAKKAYLILIECIQSRPRYFAGRIHKAIQGMGTNDKELIAIIVRRSEVDLALIRDEYRRVYNKKLVDVIRSECSGAYKDALIAIIEGN